MVLSRFLIAALAVFLAAPLTASTFELSVYHTNDIHGWIMPHKGMGKRGPWGGAAALAAVYNKDKGPKLLLDAGDFFQGTPEGTSTEGRALADIFNAVGYDAVVVGNHEYDLGEPALKRLVPRFKMPVLGANVYQKKTGRRVGYLKPWIIKEFAGVKVGILGLITSSMRNLSFPKHVKGLEFRREVSEARKAVKELRRAGATVIIAVTHMGLERPYGRIRTGDQTLAAEVEGIDLIVGGHTHTLLKKPILDATHDTLIVQAGSGLRYVGRAVLEIDRDTRKVVGKKARIIPLLIERTGEDPVVKRIVTRYGREMDKIYGRVLGRAPRALLRNREGESALGDWMTDCLRTHAGADIAIHNGGGIRADMPAGPVTLRTLFEIMPFENRLVNLVMSGALVREALDHGVAARNIIQVSGLEARYRRNGRRGKRILSLKVGGEPLGLKRDYTVVTIDFLVKGGDGYSPFHRAAKMEYTDSLVRDVLARCVEKRPLIRPPPAGRLIPREH